jgi:hypothetical protein
LVVVGDGEGDLGRLALAQPRVAGQRDDALTVVGSNRAEKRPTLGPFGVEIRRDQTRVDRWMAVEAPVEALVGEFGEEPDERVRVGLLGRAQPQSAAFPQDDVDRCVLPADGSSDSSDQWDIVPFGLPTWSKPT